MFSTQNWYIIPALAIIVLAMIVYGCYKNYKRTEPGLRQKLLIFYACLFVVGVMLYSGLTYFNVGERVLGLHGGYRQVTEEQEQEVKEKLFGEGSDAKILQDSQ